MRSSKEDASKDQTDSRTQTRQQRDRRALGWLYEAVWILTLRTDPTAGADLLLISSQQQCAGDRGIKGPSWSSRISGLPCRGWG
jgi:hypothetical protein